MNFLIKTSFIVASIAFSSLPLMAFDFGVILDGTDKAYTNDVSDISGSEGWENELIGTVTANAKGNLTASGTQRISAEGNFVYKYTNDSEGESENLKTADLTLLKYTGVFATGSAKSIVSFGRFFVGDVTSVVLSQVNDGLMYQYLSDKINASVYGGWTGLTNAHNTTVLDGEESDFFLDTDSVYYCNTSYALCSASVSFPYILFNQTITLEGIGLIGTNGINSDNGGDWRIYGTFALNGPLASCLFYKLYTCFSKEKDSDLSNLSSLYFDYYTSWKDLSFSLGGVYASGKTGSFSSFKGITSQTAFNSFGDVQYSGIIKSGLSASIKPFTNLFIKLGSDVVLKYDEKDIESDENQELKYHGTQVYASMTYQVFTDVKAALSVSDYFAKDEGNNKLLGTVSLTFAL